MRSPGCPGSAAGLARGTVLRLRLEGSNPAAPVSGQDPLEGTANYFTGSTASSWHTGVPTYQKVAYSGVYPGIDLVYYGTQGQLEYDYVVHPGADRHTIRCGSHSSATPPRPARAWAARHVSRKTCAISRP